MGGREPTETSILTSAAKEMMLERLVSSRGKMEAGVFALLSVSQRYLVFKSLVSRTVKTPWYFSVYFAAKRVAVASSMPPAAPVTIKVP